MQFARSTQSLAAFACGAALAACTLAACTLALVACEGGGSGIVEPQGGDGAADGSGLGDAAPPDGGDLDSGPGDDADAGPGGSDAQLEDGAEAEPVWCKVGEACDDLDPCTTSDECLDGICTGTFSPCEDDGIPCTLDLCDGQGGCTHPLRGDACFIDDTCYDDGEPHPELPCLACVSPVAQDAFSPDDSLSCSDGDPCTSGERCFDGECTGGVPATCDDDNPCTADSCAPGQGCAFTPTMAPCSDGDLCTLGDTCTDGFCEAGAGTMVCKDSNPCTDDSCSPTLGCMFTPNAAPCTDGNACTLGDQCTGGSCEPGAGAPTCSDGNPCTDDGCQPDLGCTFVPNAEPCSDGNACTVGDGCVGGACHPGMLPLLCDDANPCTEDTCLPASGCLFAGTTLPCDDGNACTLGDTCAGALCAPGATPLPCSDGNPCTDDGCDPSIGCTAVPNTAPCSDGELCTTGDVCSGGACAGAPTVCDDGNACTTDSCNGATGECVFAAISTSFDCIPRITITKPARAASLTGSSSVAVAGTVTSGGGPITTLTLNGTPLAVGAGGAFSTTMAASHGMNLLEFAAQDAIGNSASTKQSFYWGTKWTPIDNATPSTSAIPDGLLLWLGKTVIDDGVHNVNDIDDLATVVELIAASFDLKQYISNPIGDVSGVKISLTGLTYGAPKVSLAPIDGGLHLVVTVANLDAKLKFVYKVCVFGCFDVTASGSAKAQKVTVESDLFVAVNPTTGAVTVTSGATSATVTGLDVSLDGVIGFLTNWIINFFEGSFADQLEAAFASQLGGVLPGVVAGALQSLALNESFAIPPLVAGAPQVTVTLASTLSSAVFTPAGGRLGLKAGVLAPKNQTLPTLGVLRRNGCGTGNEASPVLGTAYPLQVGLHDDVLNEILYALWWAGGLRFPVDSALLGGAPLPAGVTGLALDVDFLLAPIVNNCNATSAPKLQIGDIHIDASLFIGPIPVALDIYASLQAAVSFSATDGPSGKELALSVGAIEVAKTDLVYDDEALLALDPTLRALIDQQLVPQLIANLTGGALAGFPIPAIDLSFINGVPPGTKLELNLTNVVRNEGYTLMRGTVK